MFTQILLAETKIDFMAILIPTLILFVLALVFSVLLAYLGKKMAVTRDEKIDLVLEQLAGANCGACGYPGCDGFATALCEGRASIGECNATSMQNKNEIAKILGVENNSVPTKIVIACRGGNHAKDKYHYQGYGDCRSMELLAGGRKMCKWGCMGMGTCVDACHDHAVEVHNDKGYSEIDHDKCIKCGRCIAACPKRIIKRIPASAKLYVACSNQDKGKAVRDVCDHGCIACGLCERNCPEKAITVVSGVARIDYSKCTGCMLCVSKCPTKCIVKLDD